MTVGLKHPVNLTPEESDVKLWNCKFNNCRVEIYVIKINILLDPPHFAIWVGSMCFLTNESKERGGPMSDVIRNARNFSQ